MHTSLSLSLYIYIYMRSWDRGTGEVSVWLNRNRPLCSSPGTHWESMEVFLLSLAGSISYFLVSPQALLGSPTSLEGLLVEIWSQCDQTWELQGNSEFRERLGNLC